MSKTILVCLLGLGALLGGTVRAGTIERPRDEAASAAIYSDSSSGQDRPGYGRSFGEQHFSPLRQIDEHTVGRLGLAWYIDLGPDNSVTQPVEVGGTLYFATGLSIIHAVDVRTGKELWRYDPRAGERAGKALRYYWGCRGIAWWNGRIYFGTVDGRLIALDARTGSEVWSTQVTEPGSGLYLAGAPRPVNGKIVVGESNGDYVRHRGFADAYNADTGKRVWRFYVVPGDPSKGFENKAMAMAAKTWTGDWWKWGPGGSPWNNFSYDAETNTVLIGTSDGFPWSQRIRSPGGGDNLFICSLVAVDADTGEYKWHYQFVPGDVWDYDATMDIELADLTIDGKARKVAMIAPKNGFFYVVDRTDGKLISAEKIARVTWATRIDRKTGRPVETPGARYPNGQDFEVWPSIRGAHSVPPMAYSPQTQLVYIPKFETGMTFNDRGRDAQNLGQWGVNLGAAKPNPLQNTSALLAWNPVTQTRAWQVDTFGGWNSGVLATGGGLVFHGQLTGQLSAYAASSGQALWHFDAQAPLLAAPISYLVDGKQYVSVMTGLGYSATAEVASHKGLVIERDQKRRVLTFALDADTVLPAAVQPSPPRPIEDTAYKPDAALEAQGNTLFAVDCAYCHGQQAIAGGYGPDLRASTAVLSFDAFQSMVRDGPLVSTGMPKWDELSDQDVAALRQYIRSRAVELRETRETHAKP